MFRKLEAEKVEGGNSNRADDEKKRKNEGAELSLYTNEYISEVL
jgi:hypothetical protein